MASLFIFQNFFFVPSTTSSATSSTASSTTSSTASATQGRRYRTKYRNIPLLISQQPNNLLVTIARGTHLFPFRTESLSPVAPMVLHLNWCGRVGSRQVFLSKPLSSRMRALLFLGPPQTTKAPLQGPRGVVAIGFEPMTFRV